MMRRLLPPALLLLACAACRAAGERAGADGAPAGSGVRIVGARNATEAELLAVVADDVRDLERRSSPKAALDDAAYSLELHYRELGFPGCRVEYRLAADGAPGARAELVVDEGPRVRVAAVRFTGHASLPARDLEPFLLPKDGRDAAWYSPRRVQDGLGAIRSYYRGQGFLDAAVELVEPAPGRTEWSPELELVVRVEEGARWFLREITTSGGLAAIDARLERAGFLDAPLTPRTASALRGRLRELYALAGHPEARVEARTDVLGKPGDARIALAVVPGPCVRITGVDVVGNERTDRDRVVSALELHPGDRYDAEKERESVRNLYGLGVFSSVGLELAGTDEERRLLVRVEERVSREVYVEPGWGSYEGPRLGVGWNELNVGGHARRLEVNGTVSAKAQRGEVGLTDPRFLDRSIVGNATLYGEHREEPSYTTTRYGGLFGLTRELGEHLELQAGYEFTFSQLDSSDVAAPPSEEEDVNISALSFAPRWDTRDRPFAPTEGVLARTGLEWAGKALGSELEFLRLRWNFAWFGRLSEQSVLALSWRGGVIAPIASTTSIPIQERFFNGGESTVRSFREDQLGPKDAGGDPTGGEAYDVFTAEFRRALVGHLEGALFVDTGNLVVDHADFLQFGDFRHAVGAGVRYLLPVGPLRFDVGVNPNPRPDEADYAAHFSVGFSF